MRKLEKLFEKFGISGFKNTKIYNTRHARKNLFFNIFDAYKMKKIRFTLNEERPPLFFHFLILNRKKRFF